MKDNINCADFPKLFHKELIELIKERRKNSHLSQAHIANLTKINQRNISLLELGKSKISLEYILKISSALNIDFIELLEIAKQKCQNKIKYQKINNKERVKQILIKYNLTAEELETILNKIKED